MFGMIGYLVKIFVGVSVFLWTPANSVVLVVSFCLHILLVTRTSRKKILEFCFPSVVN